MAYGHEPNQIQSVLRAKMGQTILNHTNTYASLDNIIRPLRTIVQTRSQKDILSNLFDAIRSISDEEIDVSLLLKMIY